MMSTTELQAPSPTDTVPDGAIGSILDRRYRLESMIGRGAWGRVYRARHLALGRAVAIKVLDAKVVADDDARRRFEREAQTAGRLRHPNCVAVSDFGTMPDGSRYLAMELADGISLEAVLANERRLPVARAVHIMRHILRGLAHAHGHGVVHRDLKPGNVMLVTDGGDRDFAKVLDFGLARMVAGEDRITRTGIVCGTPRYMSPEQVLDRAFDARADLYAASVMLFEMLAGRTPFDPDDTSTLLKMHLAAPVPGIAEVAPGTVIPVALEQLIRRGLEKNAKDRPASADQYVAELDRACAPDNATIELSMADPAILPVAVAPVKPPPSPSRRRALTRREIMIGAGVVAVLIVGLVAGFSGGGGAKPAAAAVVAPALVEDVLEIEVESAPTRDPAIDAALQLARSGRGEEAATKLRELRKRRPADAQIPYALGGVYGRLGWPKQTIDAYRDAVELDPALREDAVLVRSLAELLESKSMWQHAERVLERQVGAAAIPTLTDVAEHHRDGKVRVRAARLRDRLAR